MKRRDRQKHELKASLRSTEKKGGGGTPHPALKGTIRLDAVFKENLFGGLKRRKELKACEHGGFRGRGEAHKRNATSRTFGKKKKLKGGQENV